jgi:uncharacterized protein YdaU (DUF1376 family)
MHYFQFEIKEWIANTAHLSLEEESAYLRLIFYYYDSEKPIANADLDKIFRKCRIPKDLGCYILAEYFQCEDEQNWIHKRCDEEIARYHAKKEQASRAGKASAERRSNGRSTDVQPIINQESLIINQESIKKTKPKGSYESKDWICPVDVCPNVFEDFLRVRKAKRSPLTVTALNGLEREGKKAGLNLQEVLQMCCERGWIGFKAEWANDKAKQFNSPTSKNVSAARAIFGDERGLVNERAIDITPKKIT